MFCPFAWDLDTWPSYRRVTEDVYMYMYMYLLFIPNRVAVVGNVDAGKSTLLGVLTHGDLDNGRGVARQRLFRHKHEMETGRTSSVSNDILGFDKDGRVINKSDGHGEGCMELALFSTQTYIVPYSELFSRH